MIRRKTWKALWTLLLAFLALGCGDLTGPSHKLVPAFIFGFTQDDPQLVLEGQTKAVEVGLKTYGSSCRSKGEVRVSIKTKKRKIQLSPFDYRSTDSPCLDILQVFDHSLRVDLEAGGRWTVLLVGRDVNDSQVQFDFEVDIPN